MATRVRFPNGVEDRNRNLPLQALNAAALPLSPNTPLPDQYNYTIDYLINGEDGGADRLAFHYYRTIPELHYLISLVGAALSQVRLKVVEIVPGEDPKDLGPRHPANDLLRNFAGGVQGQADLMQRLGIHLTVTGDSVVIGPSPNQPLQYPYDDFRVYSTTEVSSRNGKIFLKMPTFREEQIPATAYATRIWKEAPESMWRADSPVKSAFTVLREIELLDAHVHATAISRLKGAGILLIPEELTLPGDEVEVEGIDGDPFVRVLVEVMELAIKNRDSAAALVPIIMRGPSEFLAQVRLIDFHNQFDSEVGTLRDNALRRLALGMDAPPEVLLGGASSAGWSMWQVSEAQLRLHIKPLAHLIAASLTKGWLQPVLKTLPMPDATRETIPSIALWPDFANLMIRPDVGADAKNLYSEFEIGGDTLRHILGLSENDKPTPEELEYQILLNVIKAGHFQLIPWAIKALKEDFGIPLPAVDELATTKGLETGAAQAKDTTPVAAAQAKAAAASGTTPKGQAPQIPGNRSVAKQTAPEKTPPANGDANNNQSNSGPKAPKA